MPNRARDSQTLVEQIHRLFAQDVCPQGEELVKHDGFDEIDKEHAEQHWLAISWQVLLDELDQGKRGNAGSLLEQWTLLEPQGVLYYLRPFALHVLAEIHKRRPDEMFLQHFFFELSDLLRRRGSGLLNSDQRTLLAEICDLVEVAVQDPQFDFWPDAIREAVLDARTLLTES